MIASQIWKFADLLALEDLLVELLLKPFICQIDTELLKAILLEWFKAVNIQNGNRPLTGLSLACNFEGRSVFKRASLDYSIRRWSLIAMWTTTANMCTLRPCLIIDQARTSIIELWGDLAQYVIRW